MDGRDFQGKLIERYFLACLQLLVVVDEPLHGGVQLGKLAAHVVVACDQSLHLRASLLLFQLGKFILIMTKFKNVELYLFLAVVQLLFQGRELLRLNFPEMLFALCTMKTSPTCQQRQATCSSARWTRPCSNCSLTASGFVGCNHDHDFGFV